MELIANVLDRPADKVTVTLVDKTEASHVILSLAGLAAAYLSELRDGYTDVELANSMRSTAGLLREIESITLEPTE